MKNAAVSTLMPMPTYAGPNQIDAQVPVDVPAGRAKVLFVDNGSGPSPAFFMDVVQAAPEIFFYPVPAVLKNANFSLVNSANATVLRGPRGEIPRGYSPRGERADAGAQGWLKRIPYC